MSLDDGDVRGDLATLVGMHECATCKRCATTYAVVHPVCPTCAERERMKAEHREGVKP